MNGTHKMKGLFPCICEMFRLVIAALIVVFFLLSFFYVVPTNNITHIIPDFLLDTTKGLTDTQKNVVNDLYINGRITDAKGLYGEIVEHYHFLIFLMFALLALVGGFVYLQIRHETTAKIDNAIKEGIADACIEKKIENQIAQADINKKIENAIYEEGVTEAVLDAMINSGDYLQQIAAIVSSVLAVDVSELRQKAAEIQHLEQDIPQLRADLGGAIAGIEAALDRVKADLETIKEQIGQD